MENTDLFRLFFGFLPLPEPWLFELRSSQLLFFSWCLALSLSLLALRKLLGNKFLPIGT